MFLRLVPVNLNRYLPRFIYKDKRFANIQKVLSDEHERQRLQQIDVEKQFFIDTATWGLDDWEKFTGIVTDKNLDIPIRRQRIKTKLNRAISVDESFIKSLVNGFLNDNSAEIITHNEQYYFDVIFDKDSCYDMKGLIAALELYKPAHLGYKRYEVQNLQQNLFVAGGIGLAETTEIGIDTSYNAEPVSHEVTSGAIIKLSEVIKIGSE